MIAEPLIPRERKRLLRRRARRHLMRMIRSPFSKCHWCDCEIVFLTEIDRSRIVKVHKNHWAQIKVNGEIKEYRVGTVDHVDPLHEGEENNQDRNLVGACEACNRKRTATKKTRAKVCIDCGGKIKGPFRRRCRKCRMACTEEYALMHLGRS